MKSFITYVILALSASANCWSEKSNEKFLQTLNGMQLTQFCWAAQKHHDKVTGYYTGFAQCHKWSSKDKIESIKNNLANLPDNSAESLTGLVDEMFPRDRFAFLEKIRRNSVLRYALAVEKFHRKSMEMENLLGGIEDWVGTAPKTDIIAYITETLGYYEFTNDQNSFEYLCEEFNVDPIVPRLGGIHFDISQTTDETFLKKSVLSIEAYDRVKRGLGQMMGGMVNQLRYMTVEDMITYILDFCDIYPEITMKNLSEINKKWHITSEKVSFLETNDYLKKILKDLDLDIEELKNIVLHCENENRTIEPFFGMVKNNFGRWGKDEYIKYIVEKCSHFNWNSSEISKLAQQEPRFDDEILFDLF
jgi:hypothetical protein